MCSISHAEVEYGLHLAPGLDPQRKQAIRAAMGQFYDLPVDRHTAAIYGEIRAKLFQNHAPRSLRGGIKGKYVEDLIDRATGKELGIQENDLWIVSVAVQYDLVFATRDRAGGMEHILSAAAHASRTEYWCPPEFGPLSQ